ncbi:MAG: selenide, water dikinase SelD [Bacteroidales bacterium]|nr:selenide, water dikinase SelD [Bacteroidales bacterium]
MNPIYLDYNATTPVDKEVAEEMKPYIEEYFGNPSSMHAFGVKTKNAVEKARKQVAELLNCKPYEIIFTSGGTESNNYAIKGIALANRKKGNHIITSSIEHPAVLEVCKYLEKNGFNVTYIPVDKFGLIDPDDIKNAITSQTILISVMHANNEVGTIQAVSDISKIAKEYGIFIHTDAAQSIGKIQTDVKELGIDLLSVAGHKLYAPKGIGALFVRNGIKLEKLIHGADHEQNLRAGTENVLEIVGLGKACEIAKRDLKKNMMHFEKMRDLLYNSLKQELSIIKLNGHPEKRLPNTLSISFPNIEANTLLSEIEGVAASAGAACHADSIDVSTVLQAMNIPIEYAMGTVRFSTGRYTTENDIDKAVEIITEAVTKLIPAEKPLQIKTPDISKIKLTHFTHGLGCACKIRPQYLEKILKALPIHDDPNVLIGTNTSDDAAVYKLDNNTAIVQSVDFFTPVVDDPYHFGAIAAANSLSDIYAMGAKPVFALNIVGFPDNRLPMDVLKQILLGAQDKAKEAGISIIGGHTVEDTEPKYGLVVTGLINPNKILSNKNAQPGDAIILTKPLGLGIISTAVKRGLADEKTTNKAIQIMSELNHNSAEVMKKFPVNACTDITGFGLLGHLKEMSCASKVNAEIILDNVPVIDKTWDLASANIVPGGSLNNLKYISEIVRWDENISHTAKLILADAQTSGGLLISLPFEFKDQILNDLHKKGITDSSFIGRFTKNGNGEIYVK